MIQNQSQIPSLIQIGNHRSDPACKICKDKNPSILPIDLFKNSRIRFSQAKPVNIISCSCKSLLKDGPGTEPIGIVVVE